MYPTEFKLFKINHLQKAVREKVLREGRSSIIEEYQCKQSHDDIECNCLFTVKRFVLNEDTLGKLSQISESFLREYNIGILLNHKYIRRTFDVDLVSNSLIFEHCPGIDFIDYLNTYESYNTRPFLKYFNQIVNAVSYLHDNGIAHIDLKLENIILDPSLNSIKLIDFGESTLFTKDKISKIPSRGTRSYASPEVINTNYIYMADKLDVWSCGIILYNLFYNKEPWNIAHLSQFRYKLHFKSILQNELDKLVFPYSESCNYYSELEIKVIYKLFVMMLNPDPEKRKSIGMVKNVLKLILI